MPMNAEHRRILERELRDCEAKAEALRSALDEAPRPAISTAEADRLIVAALRRADARGPRARPRATLR